MPLIKVDERFTSKLAVKSMVEFNFQTMEFEEIKKQVEYLEDRIFRILPEWVLRMFFFIGLIKRSLQ